MGIMPGLKAFVAAVLGGIGNIPGAVVGGLVMGIAEVMVVGYLSPTYRDAIAFVLLIVILLVRPAGHPRHERGGEGLSARGSPGSRASLALLAVLNLVLPRRAEPVRASRSLMLCGINVILAVSLNLVNGFTGQFSIGHAGFMAVGAYASAMFSLLRRRSAGWRRWSTAACRRRSRRARPLLVGAPARRPARGGSPATWSACRRCGCAATTSRSSRSASARSSASLILNIDAVGGARGLPGIPRWANFFWVGSGVLRRDLRRRAISRDSTHGRALLAIREDEIAAEALGVDTTRYKVLAFVLGAFFAGVAGGLFAHYLAYLNPNSFTFIKCIEVIVMVVLGGMGSISGSVLAAILLTAAARGAAPGQGLPHGDLLAAADRAHDHAAAGPARHARAVAAPAAAAAPAGGERRARHERAGARCSSSTASRCSSAASRRSRTSTSTCRAASSSG